MKSLIAFVLLTLTMNIHAAEFLTSSQKNEVLTQIDNICGDTWCEGDYDYSFNEINCDSETKTCALNFDYISYTHNEDGWDVVGEQRSTVTCTIEGVSKYEDMVDTGRRYGGLVWDFYEKVGECTDLYYDYAPAQVYLTYEFINCDEENKSCDMAIVFENYENDDIYRNSCSEIDPNSNDVKFCIQDLEVRAYRYFNRVD
ncbi:hypothetical protein BMS_1819 [Halobacteriovorax marinus SJ]|uniref:Uncharacterized protein n=1 Tax=Halobacteriovorax marinus (strain ATCC BAA-682 / DSM 15412 / SJ) TaxID=862908 RepID=E1X1Y1_HALMS|nr:hypothetical protein [Halobacteriovorax marinus]CBW26641.1 hypothetical protein BMS_1819 [Halobacteriovorax marinus SJ]